MKRDDYTICNGRIKKGSAPYAYVKSKTLIVHPSRQGKRMKKNLELEGDRNRFPPVAESKTVKVGFHTERATI